MRQLNDSRGGILPYALIIVATLAIAMAVLLQLQQARTTSLAALRMQREADLLFSSASNAIEGALLTSIRNGGLTGAPSLASVATQSLSAEHWSSITLADVWNIGSSFDGPDSPGLNATLFQRGAALVPLDPHPPVMGWLEDIPVRRFRFNIGATLVGVGTSSLPTPPAVSTTFTATLIEVPTVAFSFVATTSAFNEAGSQTHVQVNGYALFNAGVDRPSGSNPSVSGASIMLGGRVGDNLAGLAAVPFNGHTRGTWGLRSWDDFVATSAGGPNTPEVSQCYSSIPGRITISWGIPELDPPLMPFGISRAPNVGGKPRLVVDLRKFTAATHIYIDCSSPDTKADGVVVVGEPTNSAMVAVSVTTNGQITLEGDNVRPVLIASRYSNVVQLLSSAYLANPTTATAPSGMTWRGYLNISRPDMVYSSPAEDWSNAQLTINGTISYQGGSINGLRALVVTRDDVIRTKFAPTSNSDTSLPLSDRVALVSVTPR